MQPTVLLDGQCMLFSFTLAVMSHVCSTTVVSPFTTFCKADEDIKRDPFLWSVYWSAPTLKLILCIFYSFFLEMDSLHIYLYHQMKKKELSYVCLIWILFPEAVSVFSYHWS
jgi:hypothetical protein